MGSISRRLALAMPVLGYLAAKTRALAQVPALASAAKPKAPDTDWINYAGDLGSTRYSPVDQINPANFNTLEVAWQVATSPFGPHPEFLLQVTPLVAKGKMYFTAGTRRSVVSVDAATGEVLWVHHEDEGERGARAPRQGSGRGLAYWTDGQGDERILYVTVGYRLIALDAKTGAPVPGFGQDGVVDLRQDDDQDMDLVKADIGYNATPTIGNDVVVIGAAMSAGGQPKTHDNVKGYVRGFDVRTGKRLWIFHTIPKKGEFGYDTWLDGTDIIGNTGDWAQMSIDEALNTVYLGVELPTGDYNGQYRRGDGLFGESIVALDLKTGVRKWHFQMVHHGLQDRDVPCAAILCDLPVKGKMVKALVQPTKQTLLYVLNRETGEPIWPIIERKVPKGDVPGEWYPPTQPIPTKPPPYDLQGVSPDAVIDFTPELHEEALRLIKNYVTGPLFTPPTLYKKDGTWGTLMTPASQGGTNWPGGSYDPETYIVYVHSKREVQATAIIKNTNPAISDMDYIMGRSAPKEDGEVVRDGFKPFSSLTVQGLPLLKPPYGSLTAIDLSKGDIVWQIAHGETPDRIRNHPLLKGLTIPRTGQIGKLAPLVTKTLLVCGDAESTTDATGRHGAMLRAYDKATGAELGAVFMPGPQIGAPMTYVLNGQQHIVLAIGSPAGAQMIAFKLPGGPKAAPVRQTEE